MTCVSRFSRMVTTIRQAVTWPSATVRSSVIEAFWKRGPTRARLCREETFFQAEAAEMATEEDEDDDEEEEDSPLHRECL